MRDGHARAREAIYKWLDSFLHSLSPSRAAEYAPAAIDSLAMYGFRREQDNYCRAAALLPVQAVLEMSVGPWTTDGWVKMAAVLLSACVASPDVCLCALVPRFHGPTSMTNILQPILVHKWEM